jgi:hypothetical protein
MLQAFLPLLVAALGAACSKSEAPPPVEMAGRRGRISAETAAELSALEAREQQVAETVWAKELLAQACGRTIESLWDSLNAATNALQTLAAFPVEEVVLGNWAPPEALPHGIEIRAPEGTTSVLSSGAWRDRVEEFNRAGWQLVQTEFRHTRFDTDPTGQPQRSRFEFSAHLIRSAPLTRAVLAGDLIVDWMPGKADATEWAVKRIDASRLTLKTRSGEPPFVPILTDRMAPPRNAQTIGPLMLYDLDGDGHSEIILGAVNRVYHQRGADRFDAEPFCRYPPGLIYAALIADFDGDGVADYLCETYEGLFLFKGSPQGTFDTPGERVWKATPDVKSPFVLTCGDIDGDGDLDLFLGQYRAPYAEGAMPTPYYDAKDGDPAYLLRNDGHGRFTDATPTSGLTAKRSRRTYSASFVDLDGDHHLDLVVVSDFSGVDLYRNDGHGRFSDRTAEWVAERHAFGMAHALADFNADGRLDLLMIGMPSPTVDRLEHLGLWRPDAREDRTMRSKMTHGSRLYLAREQGGFEETAMEESIARSGWSWGCSAFDFDNDGFPDVYIGNGQDSNESVRDYEGEYWLHDTYVGHSEPNQVVSLYFGSKFNRTLHRGQSYGGYEKNRFYLNQRGQTFLEVGHLLGVALEQDSRNVVSDDLDGDGRVDLLVTTYEGHAFTNQALRVYRNVLSDAGHWIGFRFREEGAGRTPVGVRVAIQFGDQRAVRQIVTGDSHRSQHAPTVHFGLGGATQVKAAVIHWTCGQEVRLSNLAADRYYDIRPPEANPAAR